MTSETIITNARIVTADAVLDGTLKIADDRIGALDTGRSSANCAVDFAGDYLLPGMVELHTDNLERHVAPRPGVRWNMLPSVLAHDAQLTAAGITTVLDAVRIGDGRSEIGRGRVAVECIDGIQKAREAGLFRADHYLHIRCEVSDPSTLDAFDEIADRPLLRLASVMDHTPGQRQFTDLGQWKRYYGERYGKSDSELDEMFAEMKGHADRHSDPNRRGIATRCLDRGLKVASHDDATEAHVEEAIGLGLTIAEFPTTMEAARIASARGLRTVGGAPNVVRGGSHSGNIAVEDLAREDILDALSSDYIPSSLVHSAMVLHRRLGLDLPDAVNKVSRNPATMAGFDDRGEIAVGKRADLVRVRDVHDVPVVIQVWRDGRQVY